MDRGEQQNFEARLRAQIEAYHESALVYAAVKLGLPDTLAAGPVTAEQLAADLGLSAPHLHRFLRGLCTLGICEELPGKAFALTRAGQSLTSDSPSRLAEKVQIVVEQYWQPWAELVSTLQAGTPAFDEVFGQSVFDWRRDNAAQGAIYNSYLTHQTLAQAVSIVEALDLSGASTVADIGGGHGALLAAILKAHPHIEGVLFDQPHIIEGAKPVLQSFGVADRVTPVSGDFLVEMSVRADLYLLKSVLQGWDDDSARTILANCRSAMPEAAKLLIIELLLPDRASDDPAAIMLDLHVMTITGGRSRSLAEFEALLSQAGITLSQVTPTSSGLAIIEART